MTNNNKRSLSSIWRWVAVVLIAYVIVTGWKDIKQGFNDGVRDASSAGK